MTKLKIILAGLVACILLITGGWYLSDWIQQDTKWAILIYACLFSPLWEEALFRWAPIEVAKRTGVLGKIKWPLIIATSIIFAMTHKGTLSIPIQGTFGLILSIVYIETNSYWSAVLLHSLWNLMVILGMTIH
jgi:membrane protease YdiL (CAAX protease family)